MSRDEQPAQMRCLFAGEAGRGACKAGGVAGGEVPDRRMCDGCGSNSRNEDALASRAHVAVHEAANLLKKKLAQCKAMTGYGIWETFTGHDISVLLLLFSFRFHFGIYYFVFISVYFHNTLSPALGHHDDHAPLTRPTCFHLLPLLLKSGILFGLALCQDCCQRLVGCHAAIVHCAAPSGLDGCQLCVCVWGGVMNGYMVGNGCV